MVESTSRLNHVTTTSRVCFSSRVKVREFQHVEQVASLWYTPIELKQMKIDARRTVQRMRENNMKMNNDNDDMCLHGLMEKMDREVIKQQKLEALFAVLDEQRIQEEESGSGIQDHDLLADIYFEATCFSQKKALYRGLRIAQEIQIEDLQEKISSTTNKGLHSPGGTIYLVQNPRPRIKSAVCA